MTTSTVTLYSDHALAVLPQLAAETVDAVFTDPPYSSGGLFRSDRTTDTRLKYCTDPVGGESALDTRVGFSGDNRDQRAYAYWSSLWLAECWRVSKPGAVIGMFTDWRQLPTSTDALQSGGWVWRGIAVWDKTEAARPDKGRYRNQCEYVVWGSKGKLPQEDDGACLPGVFRIYGKPAEKVHIASKPVGLMRELLRIVPAGGVVFDPFMGAGSTGMACVEEGFGFVGIEHDAHWFGMAHDRIAGSKHLLGGAVIQTVRPARGAAQPSLEFA